MNANTHKSREFQEQHCVAALNVAGPLVRTTLEGLATETCAGFDAALTALANGNSYGATIHGSDREFLIKNLRNELRDISARNGEANAPIQDADIAAAKAAAGANADIDFRNIIFTDLATLNAYADRDALAGHRF